MTTLREHLDKIKSEDHIAYLQVIKGLNEKNLDNYAIRPHIAELAKPEQLLTRLTQTQLNVLFSMGFKGGYSLREHYVTNNSSSSTALASRIRSIKTSRYLLDDVDNLTKEDFPFISTYIQNKWKKENPTTTRAKKGINFQPDFNEFSLIIFKDSITKPYTRTEAKNRVLSVNKVFNNSNRDEEAIRFRNKYYKLILDNTDYHTKAMINSLHTTQLYTYVVVNNKRTQEKVYYIPHPDEAVAVQIDRWSNVDMQPYSNVDSRDSYSTDLTIAAGSKAGLSYRDAARYATASGVFTNMYTETNCEAYKTMATTIINTIDDDTKQQMLSALKGANKLYELIKEQ